MEQSKSQYRNISCTSYDRLEAYATLRTVCDILWNDGAVERREHGIITDIFARDGAEFLRLNTGTVIRLDLLRSINGAPVDNVC